MNFEVKIGDLEVVEDSALRSMKVKLANEYIQTPVKTIVTKDFYKDMKFPSDLSKLSEHFIRFNDDTLKSYYYDRKTTYKKSKSYINHKKKVTRDTTALTIVEYKNKGETAKIPSEEEIKALINASYAFSDITAIPSIPRVSRKINSDNINVFLKYVEDCLKRIENYNKKKVMGYVPMVAPAFLEMIINFYLDKGINSFYLDFDGTTLSTNLSQIDVIKRTLGNRGYGENSFLHYINISYGKAINEIGVLSARDLLSFGHGLDSLGGVHVGPKRSKEFFEWLKKHKDLFKNSTRILNKEDYGYYRYEENTNIEKIYPNDALFSPELITNAPAFSTKRKLLNIVNLQQQILETNKLREIVEEHPDKTIDYFSSKKCVKKEDIKQLKKSL